MGASYTDTNTLLQAETSAWLSLDLREMDERKDTTVDNKGT